MTLEEEQVSTAREDSLVEERGRSLVLEWVWPEARRERLQGARLEIGRQPSSRILIDGHGVSRAHAELYRQGPLYALRDLGSTNSTWLNGRAIEHAPVSPGAVLRIGGWVGLFNERAEHETPFMELAPDLFGGPELAAALEPLRRGARSPLPVVLVGATGTGKERVARATHGASGRAGPFIAVNCAALPEALAEAELFGYRRGAFTGAERPSLGHFRSAHGGTLFLDEMPELSPSVQAKLLRVLEDGQVMGLGEPCPVSVDVRVITASQVGPRALVDRGELRQDLAARLRGLEVFLPPLRQRRGDIAALFRRFLEHYSGGSSPEVDARLVEALCLYEWPDNVRELELVTRKLLAVHGHESVLRRQHLPDELQALSRSIGGSPSAALRDRRDHDLDRLQAELSRNGGNVKAAAVALGISRQRVYRLMDGSAKVKAEPS